MKRNAQIMLYGVLVLSAMAAAAPTKRFNTITIFNRTDGASPRATLIQATDGNLYGTTVSGGSNSGGTVFRITPDGVLTSLYNFCSLPNCSDGSAPSGALIQATDGNLYGTTQGVSGYSEGTVFKMSLDGTLTTIHSFSGSDGASPMAGLVEGIDGSFYGTTLAGGNLTCENPAGCGTIFKITPVGVLTTLYRFCTQPACTDGANPEAGLVQSFTGGFFGTTSSYGAYADGTIFKITRQGTLTTLHNFSGSDGMEPFSGLVQASNGTFFGTTLQGGSSSNCYLGCGTVFKMTLTGTFVTLHSFDDTDGANPQAGLVQGTDGNFYGTTSDNHASGDGTIFRIKPDGTLTTLVSFNGNDGLLPYGDLLQATNGSFYGTTAGGGTYGQGTIFDLIGLNPFVKMQPNYGTVGTQINILGSGLTGATAVSFNGLSAQFTVQSPSLIVATVPAGATSGPIIVTLPTQTLSSTFPFYIRP